MAPPPMVIAPPPPPVQHMYGGGSANAEQATQYINGKRISLLPGNCCDNL